MTSAFDTLDLLLRGGATALNLLVAIQFLRAAAPRFLSVSGSLLAISIAAFGPASSNQSRDGCTGCLPVALVVPAVPVSAFFWWFALALFRDSSGCRWAFAAPHALQHRSRF